MIYLLLLYTRRSLHDCKNLSRLISLDFILVLRSSSDVKVVNWGLLICMWKGFFFILIKFHTICLRIFQSYLDVTIASKVLWVVRDLYCATSTIYVTWGSGFCKRLPQFCRIFWLLKTSTIPCSCSNWYTTIGPSVSSVYFLRMHARFHFAFFAVQHRHRESRLGRQLSRGRWCCLPMSYAQRQHVYCVSGTWYHSRSINTRPLDWGICREKNPVIFNPLWFELNKFS